MYRKYFAWSFDDGLEQDKRIIKTLKEYEMGATFHLNSGMFGDKTYVGRIGNPGMREISVEAFESGNCRLLPYAPHFRIPEDEVRDVYAGFEIAGHTCHHVNLMTCSQEDRLREIADDIISLSDLFDQKVTGFAYPYGMGAKQSRKALNAAGVQYARLAVTDSAFLFPEDPLAMPLTCRFTSEKVFPLIEQFKSKEPEDHDLFFLMFAHGYECDFGTAEANWEKFENICAAVAGQKDIVCCSIGQALRHHAKD